MFNWQLAIDLVFIPILFFNPFQLSVAFHIETSHLFCFAKQITGFYMKRNTALKWVKKQYRNEN